MHRYCDLLTSAGRKHFLFAIQVVFVAFHVAATALQGRWGLEDVPEWQGAHLTARGEMIECRHKLVTFVGAACWPLGRRKLHGNLLLLLTLTLVVVEDLKKREKKKEIKQEEERENDYDVL